ncbi:replication initiation protein [Bartonella rattimassiliensis]|nr:replication initiation protein [Bartonella rattimassiliensis]
MRLLTCFKNSGTARYTVDDFYDAMDCTEKQRKNFDNIKHRIIEPAITELAQKGGGKLTGSPSRLGRKL